MLTPLYFYGCHPDFPDLSHTYSPKIWFLCISYYTQFVSQPIQYHFQVGSNYIYFFKKYISMLTEQTFISFWAVSRHKDLESSMLSFSTTLITIWPGEGWVGERPCDAECSFPMLQFLLIPFLERADHCRSNPATFWSVWSSEVVVMDLAALSHLDGIVSRRCHLLGCAARTSGNPLEAQLDVGCQGQPYVLKTQFLYGCIEWGRGISS